MKEIKYKIWNKVTKRFVHADTDVQNRKGYDLGEYALSPRGKVFFFESTEGGMDTTAVDGVEVVFFTGLKDKNGVEIYEGDIITTPGGEIGSIVWEPNMLRWMIDWRDYKILSDLSNYWQHLTPAIIGNICENPELLPTK